MPPLLDLSHWHILILSPPHLHLNLVVFRCCKLPGVEPEAPPVGAPDKFHSGVKRYRVNRHPEAHQATTVDRVVRLVLVPRGFLLSSRFLIQDMLMVED